MFAVEEKEFDNLDMRRTQRAQAAAAAANRAKLTITTQPQPLAVEEKVINAPPTSPVSLAPAPAALTRAQSISPSTAALLKGVIASVPLDAENPPVYTTSTEVKTATTATQSSTTAAKSQKITTRFITNKKLLAYYIDQITTAAVPFMSSS
jgi:hypothetical protein